MRSGFEERGIGMTLPCWTSQRSATCASDRPLLFCDLLKYRVADDAATAERAIGGEHDPALAAGGQQSRLIEIGMVLGLQVHERFRAQVDRLVEQRNVEIRHADLPREAPTLRVGERAHGFLERDFGVRPMHQ